MVITYILFFDDLINTSHMTRIETVYIAIKQRLITLYSMEADENLQAIDNSN